MSLDISHKQINEDQPAQVDGSRREDHEIVTGTRQYTGDLLPDNTLHAAIYRSPHAHAELNNIDLSRARAMEGVFDAWSFDSLPAFVKPMNSSPLSSLAIHPLQDNTTADNPRIKSFDHYPLAAKKTRFVGEPVAIVAAEDPYVAEDAIEKIKADYEPLEPVLDEMKAIGEESPLVYDEWGDNELLNFEIEHGNTETAFDRADHVIEEEIRHHRFTGTPLETRSVVASFDPEAVHVIVNASVQKPHSIATKIQHCLDIPGISVDVKAENIGGGFGQKTGYYPEDLLIPSLAIETNRPVKWVERRQEHLTSSIHAREQTHRMAAGVTAEGDILGISDEIIANSGVAYPHAAVAAHLTTAQFMTGAYDIQDYRCTVHGMVTNKAPFGAHRGFGKAESAFVIERFVDIIARELGLDPADVRYRNFIQPEDFPYRSASGSNYDSGNYPRALERALELLEYERWRTEQDTRRDQNSTVMVGIGMGVCVEPSAATRRDALPTPGYYAVKIRIDLDGKLYVYPEDPDIGTSHEESILTIVQDILDVDQAQVAVRQGNTEMNPYGSGTYSSRFSVMGTSAVRGAVEELGERLCSIAGKYFGESSESLALSAGGVQSSETGNSLSIAELAHLSVLPTHLPEGMDPGLELTYHYPAPNIDLDLPGKGRFGSFSAHPYTADAAIVLVDVTTGVFRVEKYVSVHDCGNMLQPKIVEGQHLGALAHGFGGALSESLPYDSSGNPLHQTFTDYAVPTANEIPEITLEHIETPSPFTPGGHKGAGETGTVSVPPVLLNAVEDALVPLGVEFRDGSPITPGYIWEHISRQSNSS